MREMTEEKRKRGFTTEQLRNIDINLPRNEKHHNWKGNAVGYGGLHDWITRKRGKPSFCEHCKKSDLRTRCYQWANKSHEYKRDLSDWIRLCGKCHKKYDKKTPDFCKCGKVHCAKGFCKNCYEYNRINNKLNKKL